MRGLVLAAALTLACSAGAQSYFSETLEVRVVNVDVIVTKNGKPVPGLTVDDFELYENGDRREISNFAEVAETTAAGTLTPAADSATTAVPQDLHRRSIILFIDDAALHPLERNAIFTAMRAFLHDNVRPWDTVTMLEWSSSLRVELEASSDRTAIDAAIDRLSKRTTRLAAITGHEEYSTALADLISTHKMREPPEKPRFEEAITIVSGWADRVSYEMRRRAEALKSVIASLRGGHERKVLVLLTQRFASNPGEEAFVYLDSIRTEFAGGGGSAIMDAKRYELTGLATSIGEMANSSGITLYPLDAAGKYSDIGLPDASQSVRMGVQMGFVPHTSTALLQAIAAETGGVATTGSTNWKLAFSTIANDLSTYYSLGYHAPAVREDGLKRIEVKLRKRGYAVRTRHAIVEQTAGSEMNDAVSANLFRASATNDLRLQASAAASSPAIDSGLTVPVTITIPMEALTLVPDGADLTGSFSLYAAFLRDDGAVSHVSQQPHRFRFPASSLARRKQITLQLDVSADARTDAISVGVLDELSKATGFATVKLP
jgi:VWFA-related protein